MISPEKERFVHLVYLDDSAEEGKFQIIGAIIVPEGNFMVIEEYLAHVIDELVPEELRDKFEFHASAMLNAKSGFEQLSRDKALEIMKMCTSIVTGANIPLVYGAVDMPSLRSTIYATAQPIDIAFRMCSFGVAGWFHENFSDQLGIFICDDSEKRDTLRKAFRAYRRRLKSAKHERGLLEYIHDDMYFGDSAYSVGIQLADICSYIILRHLKGMQDTEYLYEIIEPHIFFGVIEPDGQPHGNAKALSEPKDKASWMSTLKR